MSVVIRAAARTLPAGIRDRYREQWLADVRDAPEAGVSPASIALAALAFAFTYDRRLPMAFEPSPELVQRRTRLAAALALSAALLGFAGFARLNGSGGLSGVDGYDVVIGLIDGLLVAYSVLAAIMAAGIVTRTRAIPARVRAAVWLLVAVAASPIGHMFIDGLPVYQGDMFFMLGGVVYPVAAIALVVAVRLLWRGLRHPEPGSRVSARAIVLGAGAVLAVGALGFAQGAIAWASRVPLQWSWNPGTATTVDSDGTMVQWDIFPTRADYEQWLALDAQFELMVNAALAGYALATVASIVALIALARVVRLRPSGLAIAAVGMLLVGASALLWRMDIYPTPPFIAPELMLAVGRLLVVGVVLYSVGGLRYLPRVRHRHDVEGGVDLLKG